MAYFSRRRRCQGQCDPERLQDAERFPDLAGFLALFQIDDEPQPRPGGQGEILLRDAQPFAGVPNHAADLLGVCISSLPPDVTVREHFSRFLENINEMFPYGNI